MGARAVTYGVKLLEGMGQYKKGIADFRAPYNARRRSVKIIKPLLDL